VTDPLFIDRERYFDRGFFELERERLWPHTSQMACRLEEIPEVGDDVEYRVSDQSVLVVRTGPDEVKAYMNACRHRATQLALGCGSFCSGQIVCPFHGWRWGIDGTPSFLYGEEGFAPVSMADADLRLVRVPGGDVGRVRVGQPRPRRPAAAGGARPHPVAARPPGRGRMVVTGDGVVVRREGVESPT
jgi:nitrite reductase/ring-hydroxylating ferredoxin subunit